MVGLFGKMVDMMGLMAYAHGFFKPGSGPSEPEKACTQIGPFGYAQCCSVVKVSNGCNMGSV